MPAAGEVASFRPPGWIDLGVLTREITPELVDEVIGLPGCREKRQRLLPARAVVYFVLGLCLFSGADSSAPPDCRSVTRWLTNGVRPLHGLALPANPALTRARQRLGSKPLELLFDLRRGALAGRGTAGAFAFGLRLAAWDGTGTDWATHCHTAPAGASTRTPRHACNVGGSTKPSHGSGAGSRCRSRPTGHPSRIRPPPGPERASQAAEAGSVSLIGSARASATPLSARRSSIRWRAAVSSRV